MPSIALHPPNQARQSPSSASSSVPPLLRTPVGLAIMELQGHINVPVSENESSTRIGRLVFPDFDESDQTAPEGSWMKKVYFYIGHQRMLGQIKKLPKPLAVIGRKGVLSTTSEAMDIDSGSSTEELEVLEIVRWKIVFNSRPEPVGEGEGDRS